MSPPRVVVRAPGRVNLIGEHTDYNLGPVLPFAIGAGVHAEAAARKDAWIVLRSEGREGEARFLASTDARAVEPAWARLPAAVLAGLGSRGLDPGGLTIRYGSDLAEGGGLSSSAAFAVATALAAVGIARRVGRSVPPELEVRLELAEVCREAERVAFGVRCGLMDPYVVLHGRAGCLCMLDCRDRTHRDVPVDPEGVAFVVADSGVRRRLATGAYDERREQCEEAARQLGVPSLRAASVAEVEGLAEPFRRRARHVVEEIVATFATADALERGDLATVGALLDDSHRRLRDDFEVSCPELDALVATARSVPGVLGSRMTGAGFGGSTVTAVEPGAVAALVAAIAPAAARVVVPSAGATCYSPGPDPETPR